MVVCVRLILTFNNLLGEPNSIPAFVVPAYVPFTQGQLVQMNQAGQQPGVPFQIGETNALRAVGDRKKAMLIDVAMNIRKNSIYFERAPRSRIAVGFTYDSFVPAQLNLYVTAKDRSDASKLK